MASQIELFLPANSYTTHLLSSTHATNEAITVLEVWSIFPFAIKCILGIKCIFPCSFANKRMRLLTRVYGSSADSKTGTYYCQPPINQFWLATSLPVDNTLNSICTCPSHGVMRLRKQREAVSKITSTNHSYIQWNATILNLLNVDTLFNRQFAKVQSAFPLIAVL